MASAFIALGMLCESPRAMAVCASLSCLGAMATLSSWWTCAREISGRHLGALFGLMNGLGVFGAMGSQFFFGAFADWRESQGFTGRDQFDPAFFVYVAVLGLILRGGSAGVAFEQSMRAQIDNNAQIPPEARDWMIRVFSSRALPFVMAMIVVPTYAVFGMLGALLGRALLKKKPSPPSQPV
jgi:hypothetical protein